MDLSFADVKYKVESPVSSANVSDNKAEFKELHIKLKNILNIVQEKHSLKVGWFASAVYPNGELVGNVAKKQEFGFTTYLDGNAIKVPPRPFVRPAKRKNIKAWQQITYAGIINAIKKKNADLLPTFDRLGFKVAGDIKRAIKDVYYPPLSDYTISQRMKRRGIDNMKDLTMTQVGELVKPLEDTGKMISTVDFHSNKG